MTADRIARRDRKLAMCGRSEMKAMTSGKSILAGLFLAALTGAAAGDEISSIYTRLAFDTDCVQLSADPMGRCLFLRRSWRLRHPAVGMSDLRQSVFFGYVGDWYADDALGKHCGAFNAAHQRHGRMAASEGRSVPFATILRCVHRKSRSSTPAHPTRRIVGQVLVSRRRSCQPGAGDACVVGYVDALANGNANEMARELSVISGLPGISSCTPSTSRPITVERGALSVGPRPVVWIF